MESFLDEIKSNNFQGLQFSKKKKKERKQYTQALNVLHLREN